MPAEGEATDLMQLAVRLWDSDSSDGVQSSCVHKLQSGRTVEIVSDLRSVLFPVRSGKFGGDIQRLGDVLRTVHERLSSLIHDGECERHTCCDSGCCPTYRTATSKADEFLRQLPRIRTELALDIQAAYAADPAAQSVEEIILAYPGVFAIMVYRLAHTLHRLQVNLIPRLWAEYAHGCTGVDIHPGARIGHSFFIDHGTGVVIGETAEIGNHARIYQGVTLGALSIPHDGDGNLVRRSKRHPTIEDDVIIYAGATILGGTTVIGRGSVIGGNAWITSSVPPRSKVLNRPTIEIRSLEVNSATG